MFPFLVIYSTFLCCVNQRPGGDEKPGDENEKQDEDNRSEIFTLFQEAPPCTSMSSANKNSLFLSLLKPFLKFL